MLSLNMATAGCRFSIGMIFSSEAEKDAFKLRVDSARRILFPYESTSQRPDNAALLNAMLDIVLSIPSTTPSTIQSTHSFLDTAGTCTIFINVSRLHNFVTYRHTPVRVGPKSCVYAHA